MLLCRKRWVTGPHSGNTRAESLFLLFCFVTALEEERQISYAAITVV